jgi:DnaJ-like protein
MANKAAAKRNAPLEDLDEEAPRPVTFSASVTRSRKETGKDTGRPAPAKAAAAREVPAKPAASGVGRYLEVLGVGPNATFDAINTAYYTCLKRYPENPTEEDDARLQEVKRAYEILRRNYQPKETRTFSWGLSLSFGRKTTLPVLGAVTLLLLGGLVALNWKNLRLKMIHYDKGTVVALKGTSEPYGTIAGYESMHRFPAGKPSPAYELKLEGRDMTVWVGERLVVNGMQPLKTR